MKKTYLKKTILIFVLIVISIFEVNALDNSEYKNQVANKEAILVCAYGNKESTYRTEIFYTFRRIDGAETAGPWHLYYTDRSSKNNSWKELIGYSFSGVFSENKLIHFGNKGTRFKDTFESEFICPNYYFIADKTLNPDELCFSDSRTCGNEFKNGPYKQLNDGTTIFEVINKYVEKMVYQDIQISDIKNTSNLSNIIKTKVLAYLKKEYSFGITYKIPDFINNYVKNIEKHINYQNSEENYKELQEKVLKDLEEKIQSGEMSEEEGAKIKDKVPNSFYEAMGSPSGVVDDTVDNTCNGILGEEMTKIVKNIFNIIQYSGPILVVIFTIVDFFKIVLSGDQAEMKKLTNKFVKRLISAILLFFIPVVCGVLFDIAGLTVPNNCLFD